MLHEPLRFLLWIIFAVVATIAAGSADSQQTPTEEPISKAIRQSNFLFEIPKIIIRPDART